MWTYIKQHKHECILSAVVLVYVILFSILSINRFYTFRSHYFDLGIMDQVVYNTSRGRILEMTNQDLETNLSRFAIHFDPILTAFAPFYWIYAGPEILLIGQAIIVLSGAFAVYFISKELIKSKNISLLFALSYLNFFPVLRMILFDFHSIALATTFILFAYYFVLKKRYFGVFICIVLSLLTKENVGLVTGLFGLYVAIFHKQWKVGLGVMCVSALFFFGTVFYIIPQARQGQHFALKYFNELGSTPSEVIIGVLTKPHIVLAPIFSREGQEYMRRLFMSHWIFIVFAPLEFLISLPELLLTLISKNNNMRTIYFHYQAVITPFILIAAINGFMRAKKFVKGKLFWLVLAIFMYSNLTSIYYYTPLPLPFLHEPFEVKPLNEKKFQDIQLWKVKLADENIVVASTPQIAPFFTQRKIYYNLLFDPAFQSLGVPQDDIIKNVDRYLVADYVVVAKSEFDQSNPVIKSFYDHLNTQPDFKIVYDSEEIQVFKKK